MDKEQRRKKFAEENSGFWNKSTRSKLDAEPKIRHWSGANPKAPKWRGIDFVRFDDEYVWRHSYYKGWFLEKIYNGKEEENRAGFCKVCGLRLSSEYHDPPCEQ